MLTYYLKPCFPKKKRVECRSIKVGFFLEDIILFFIVIEHISHEDVLLSMLCYILYIPLTYKKLSRCLNTK